MAEAHRAQGSREGGKVMIARVCGDGPTSRSWKQRQRTTAGSGNGSGSAGAAHRRNHALRTRGHHWAGGAWQAAVAQHVVSAGGTWGNSSVKGAHWGQSQPTHASALGMPVSTPVSTAVSTHDSAPVGEASIYELEEAGGVAEAQVLHAVPVCHAAPQGDHLDRLPRQQLGCSTAQSGAAAVKGSALLHLFGGEDRRPGQLQIYLRGGE